MVLYVTRRKLPTVFPSFFLKKCAFQILGVSESEDRGGVTINSIQFNNIGRVGDKSFKECQREIGGGRVGDNNILTFLCSWLDKKECRFKKLRFGQFFLLVFVKFRNS